MKIEIINSIYTKFLKSDTWKTTVVIHSSRNIYIHPHEITGKWITRRHHLGSSAEFAAIGTRFSLWFKRRKKGVINAD